ncbi:MAG: HAMP domain-containing protein, partial [Caldilineaceae bacterium]|nr:HAMP domain-containing protein [Caldilineaceae bacterium]
STQSLSARLNLPASEDEVGRLAATFDSMLTRLDNGFRREQQFTADASHELRTPLSAMQTIIDGTLARRRAPAEYEQALADLAHETKHMRTLTEGLLHLA